MRDELTVVAAFASELPRPQPAAPAAWAVLGPGPSWTSAPILPGEGALLITGSCGALIAGPRRGELVLPQEVVAASGGEHRPDPRLVAELQAAAERLGLATARGRLLAGASVIDDPGERLELSSRHGCDFVDQESDRLARLAEGAGRPWAVLRFVSDTPSRPLGFVAELLGAWPQRDPSPGRLLLALARRPRHLPALAGLGLAVGRGRARVGRLLSALPG